MSRPGGGGLGSPELDDDTLAMAVASTEGKSFTLASIMDESDDDLSDVELDADVKEALAAVQGAAEVRKQSAVELGAEVDRALTERAAPAERSSTSGAEAVPEPPTTSSVPARKSANVPVDAKRTSTRSSSASVTSEDNSAKTVAPGVKTSAPKVTQMEKRRNKHGKVLRSVLLTKMSQHMASPSTQREVGIPTVICVHEIMAIGTGRGFVLVYEANQNPNMLLGTVSSGSENGAVTAIAANHDNTRLLVGHEMGQIVRWDLSTGKLLNVIDCHPRGVAVIGITFTDEHTGALSNNAQGFVFMHNFKRTLGMRSVEDTCIFSAKQGEVCLMQLLHHPPNAPRRKDVIVALGQLHKIFICYVKPEFRVAYCIPRNEADGDQIPSLSWNYVPIKTQSDTLVWDPVLAFGWGTNVRFMQLIDRGDDKPVHFKTLGTFHSKVQIISIRWLSERVIMTMDRQERVHVIDVKAMVLVDIVDLTRVQLAFNDKFSVQLCKERKRDPAAQSLKAYDQSIAAVAGTACNIFLLGMNSVHLISIMLWHERISFLTSHNKFVPALELAMSFYEDTALAVAGMPKQRVERTKLTRAKLIELLQSYVALTIRSDQGASFEHYTGAAKLCIDYSLRMETLPMLFGQLYPPFGKIKLARAAFFGQLEPLVLDGTIRHVPAQVMTDMLRHYESAGNLRRLEECVVKLDVSSLDLQQFVVLCWHNRLYDAMIYVYNQGVGDYTTPLKELLKLLDSSIDELVEESENKGPLGNASKLLNGDDCALGCKLLLYINNCLCGKAFPTGEIDRAHVRRVKWEVYSILRTRENEDGSDELFPFLRTLLRFDTGEFLNVLALAFAEPDSGRDHGDSYALPKPQGIVDIMLDVMVGEPARNGVNRFTPEQVGQLFTFLARQMARKRQITVDTRMFDAVQEYLMNPDDPAQREEREQAVLELLNVGKMQLFSDPDRLLKLSEDVNFYRVSQLVYEKRGLYHKVLDCYLKDASRRDQIFNFIHYTLQNHSIAARERSLVREQTVTSVRQLTSISPQATARLLLSDFQSVLKPIVSTLDGHAEAQYHLLDALFKARESATDEEFRIASEIHEKFLALMCQLRPGRVFPYLKTCAQTEAAYARSGEGMQNPVPYRLEAILDLTRKFRILDATAFLLEKKGDFAAAYALVHATLKENVSKFDTAYLDWLDNRTPDNRADTLKRVRTILAVAIQTCIRSSARLDEAGREGLWFPMLDVFVDAQQAMKTKRPEGTAEYLKIFRDLTRHIVLSMIEYVALPAILQKVMVDTNVSRNFGEMKDLISGLVDTYSYEKTLLDTTNRIVGNDLYWAMRNRADTNKRGRPMRGRALRRRQEDERRRGRALDGGEFSIAIAFERLSEFQKQHETAKFAKMLEELDAFRHGEGAPPMPHSADQAEPFTTLNTAVPRIRGERQNPRRPVGGYLPETSSQGEYRSDAHLQYILGGGAR